MRRAIKGKIEHLNTLSGDALIAACNDLAEFCTRDELIELIHVLQAERVHRTLMADTSHDHETH